MSSKSKTATTTSSPSGPRDYVAIAEAYCRDVLSGREVACQWVRLACRRQVRDLKRASGGRWLYEFSAWHAHDVCDFIEKLPHVEGQWATPTITLEPWQVFILTTIFGWRRRSDGHRRFNTAYLEVARKNAKSTIASAIALYCLTCEGEIGPQVKCAATTGGQARIVFNVCAKMVEKTPDLQEEFEIVPLANSIVSYSAAGGNITPINAKASTQDGLNPSCTIIDELHAHANRSLFDVLKSARGARQNPLSFYPTTAGYNLLGVCYEQRTFVTKVLTGVYEAEHYFGIIYTLDEADDPYDERVWKKSNPNLGVSVNLDELRGYAAEARNSPESEGEYKTKRQNLWLNAAKAWLNMAQWDACARPVTIDEFVGQPCWIGADLAQSDDLAAVARLFLRDGLVYAFVTYYLPRDVVEERAKAVPAYRIWADAGRLVLTEGSMIDYSRIEADIRADAERFDVRAMRFDQFGSVQITGRLFNDGLPAAVLPKNPKTFTMPSRELETRVKYRKFVHDGHQALKWNASNAVVRRGVDDSLLPKKEHPESPNKIDGIDAILEALAVIVTELEDQGSQQGPLMVV